MKSKPRGIEALSVRRAVVADTDKVRYRVYSSPTEFIAVIAESALMAVKVSGISKPHKIVRDLPTEGIAIEAKKMAASDAKSRVTLPTKNANNPSLLVAEIPAIEPDARQALFKPMNLADLQHGGAVRARILPPDLLSEIIDQHAKAKMPSTSMAPLPEKLPEQPSVPEPKPLASAPPELSPTERVLQAAAEVLPTAENTEAELSPEEVEKLLNG